jgi:hypothetical protein
MAAQLNLLGNGCMLWCKAAWQADVAWHLVLFLQGGARMLWCQEVGEEEEEQEEEDEEKEASTSMSSLATWQWE